MTTFRGRARPLPEARRRAMTGVSWREGCPVGLDDLALLELDHLGLDGLVHRGELVVAARVADAVLAAFARIFAARFPIARMRPIEAYGGSDDASMADNNTSAFNCRAIIGGGRFSQHAFGTAIDVNPLVNPYVKGDLVLPPAGAAYLDRTAAVPGLITAAGPVVAAFRAIGWSWGGDWEQTKDYQHFSENGR